MKVIPGKVGGILSSRGVFDRELEVGGRSAPKEPVDKVDLADINNAQSCIPYMADIHRHYREAEVRPAPIPREDAFTRALVAAGAAPQSSGPPRAPRSPSPFPGASVPALRARPARSPDSAVAAPAGAQHRVGNIYEQADRHQREDARDPD